MNKFKEDQIFGEDNEKDILDLLKNKFSDIHRTKSKYSAFDYEGPNIKIELKSRRVVSYYYPTTMISLSKINKCTDSDILYLFLFKFTDQLLYIEYDKSLFNNFEIKSGGRYDRKGAELNYYVYIPIEYLKEFNEL